jgi:hypothetical protein
MKFHGLVCIRVPAASTWVNISMGLSVFFNEKPGPNKPHPKGSVDIRNGVERARVSVEIACTRSEVHRVLSRAGAGDVATNFRRSARYVDSAARAVAKQNGSGGHLSELLQLRPEKPLARQQNPG